jgi:hypothetical protein
MADKKTLLETVREYGFFEVKEVIEATGLARNTLQDWNKKRNRLLRIILMGLQAEKANQAA